MKLIKMTAITLLLLGITTNAFSADLCSSAQNVEQLKKEIAEVKTQIRYTKVKEGVLIGVGVTGELAAILFTGGAITAFQAGAGVGAAVVVWSGVALTGSSGGIVAFFK